MTFRKRQGRGLATPLKGDKIQAWPINNFDKPGHKFYQAIKLMTPVTQSRMAEVRTTLGVALLNPLARVT
jgi:hypothetical protein